MQHRDHPIDIYLEETLGRGISLAAIDRDKRDRNICIAACVGDVEFNFDYVPKEYIDYDFLREIAKRSTESFLTILEKIKNSDLYPNIVDRKKLFLVMIKNDGSKINFVPDELFEKDDSYRVKIYTAAVKNHEKALEYVPNVYRTKALCVQAVKAFGNAIKYVPDDLRSFDIYKLALQSDPTCFEHFPKEVTQQKNFELSKLAVKLYGKNIHYVDKEIITLGLYKMAVKTSGELIKEIPVNDWNKEIIIDALKDNSMNLEIIMKRLTEESDSVNISELKQFLPEFYLVAVMRYGGALQFIPKAERTSDICLHAVKNGGHISLKFIINHIPKSAMTEDIYKAAFAINLDTYQYFPAECRSKEMRILYVSERPSKLRVVLKEEMSDGDKIDICEAAVRKDSLLLRHVPAGIRRQVIKNIGIEEVLRNNYSARNYMSGYVDDAELKRVSSSVLGSAREIIIVKGLSRDQEIRDATAYYQQKYRGKTISVSGIRGLEALLSTLEVQDLNRTINLTFISHAATNSDQISGISSSVIAKVVKKYSTINGVKLMACNTAKSKTLPDDIIMQETFKEAQKTAIAFIATNAGDIEAVSRKIFSSKAIDKNTGTIYVLSRHQDDHGDIMYVLHEVKKNVTGEIIINKSIDLTKEQSDTLFKKLGKKVNKVFPSGQSQQYNVAMRRLNQAQVDFCKDVFDRLDIDLSIFDKEHPRYSEAKTIYPFMGSMTIDVSESSYLTDSLLKKVVESLVAEGVNRDLVVKGYTQSVHIGKRQKLIGARHVYSAGYSNKYNLFLGGRIDRDKLAKDRKEMRDKFGKAKGRGETYAKAVKVKFKLKATPEQKQAKNFLNLVVFYIKNDSRFMSEWEKKEDKPADALIEDVDSIFNIQKEIESGAAEIDVLEINQLINRCLALCHEQIKQQQQSQKGIRNFFRKSPDLNPLLAIESHIIKASKDLQYEFKDESGIKLIK